MGGKTPKVPAPPKPVPVAAMPWAQDKRVETNAKKVAANKISESGRAATILSKDKGFG